MKLDRPVPRRRHHRVAVVFANLIIPYALRDMMYTALSHSAVVVRMFLRPRDRSSRDDTRALIEHSLILRPLIAMYN